MKRLFYKERIGKMTEKERMTHFAILKAKNKKYHKQMQINANTSDKRMYSKMSLRDMNHGNTNIDLSKERKV